MQAKSLNKDPIVFLLVEDSEHDVTAFRRAWRANGITDELKVVRSGLECLDYLHRRGQYRREENAPRPRVILLNNRMPRLDGLTVLEKIRQDAEVENIPVILFTSAESDLKENQSYALGANAYVVKPTKYEDLSCVVRSINDFWKLVEVPEKPL
jgi:two-component system response regulator